MMLKVAKLGIAIAAVLAWIVPAAYAGVPDVTNSFYVPQRGPVGTPIEGAGAVTFFRVCPNNDPTGIAQAARIKVVVRDVNGTGIVGVAAADICMLFNGGTPAQGFSGVGSDSVIANRQLNPTCPDVRCAQADGPTDANGTTYITFYGSSPLTPGVPGPRDPFRKWGHYDSEIPVYVLGFKLNGRLTTADVNGSYVLRIKNYDESGGLGTNPVLDPGEIVSGPDGNQMTARIAGTRTDNNYWYDLNSDGLITGSGDGNQFVGHLTGNHSCTAPINP